jgi:hypothetical protein
VRGAVLSLALVGSGCGGDPAPAGAGPLAGAPIEGVERTGAAAGDAPAEAPVSAPVPAAALAAAPPLPPTSAATAPLALDFERLAAWDVPKIRLPRQLPPAPEAIQALHGRRVALSGYLVPDRMGDGHRLLTALFIKHLAACCFGTIPKLNEWVHLEIAPDAAIEFNLRRPARVEGVFLVGPHSTGEVSHSLYRIVATRITEDEEYRG